MRILAVQMVENRPQQLGVIDVRPPIGVRLGERRADSLVGELPHSKLCETLAQGADRGYHVSSGRSREAR